MGKLILLFFGLTGKKNKDLVDCQYDKESSLHRETDIVYKNNSFDGGDSKEEKNYKLYKASDLF